MARSTSRRVSGHKSSSYQLQTAKASTLPSPSRDAERFEARRAIFEEIGRVRWDIDAFEIETELGATLTVCPFSEEFIPKRVHVDRILVPERMKRRGIATKAMAALCKLADKYQFQLEGGPIGFSDPPWRDKFVKWILSFGFNRDRSQFLPPIDEPGTFYVRRLPGRLREA